MALRKALLIAAASMAVVMGALLPTTARPDNHVAGEQKWWSGDGVHVVGEDDGWGLGVNYDDWARVNAGIPTGDQLEFIYDPASHNVVQVDENEYNNCIVPNNADTWDSGDDFLAIGDPGTYFFMCGMGDPRGMKLRITAIRVM